MTHEEDPLIRRIDQLTHTVSDLNLNLVAALARIDLLNERIKRLEQQRTVLPSRYR